MVYEVTGVYPAPSFFGLEVEDNGNVKVSIIRDLLTDSLQLTLYQVCGMKTLQKEKKQEEYILIHEITLEHLHPCFNISVEHTSL